MMDYIKHSSINQTSSGLPVYEFIIDSAADVETLPTMEDKKAVSYTHLTLPTTSRV